MPYILTIVLIFFANQAIASPSFNCAKATNNIEKIICRNKNLGQLDNLLNKIFRKALQTEASKKIQQEQLAWLKIRNKDQNNNDIQHIESLYENRIRNLLRDKAVRNFILNDSFLHKNFIEKVQKNQYLMLFASIACMEDEEIDRGTNNFDLYNGPISLMIKRIKSMKISPNKLAVFVSDHESNSAVAYSGFVFEKTRDKIIVKKLMLPITKNNKNKIVLNSYNCHFNEDMQTIYCDIPRIWKIVNEKIALQKKR